MNRSQNQPAVPKEKDSTGWDRVGSAGRQPHSFIVYCFGLGATSAELICTDGDLLAREAENFESLILRKPLQASVLDSRVTV